MLPFGPEPFTIESARALLAQVTAEHEEWQRRAAMAAEAEQSCSNKPMRVMIRNARLGADASLLAKARVETLIRVLEGQIGHTFAQKALRTVVRDRKTAEKAWLAVRNVIEPAAVLPQPSGATLHL